MRVVATYTTLPGREYTLEESIKSLLAQKRKLDVIYITIPKEAIRLGVCYTEPSDFLKKNCVIVTPDQDYGPITKIYGALMREKDPKTCILSCDDDVIFPPEFVSTLMGKRKKYPRSAICGTGAMFGRGLWFLSIVSSIKPFDGWKGFTGFRVGKNGRPIDIAFGVGGVLYNRGMFPPREELYDKLWKYSIGDKDIFHNDDVLISGYLSGKNIERRLFLDIPSITHVGGEAALSGDVFKMLSRMWVAITKVQEMGYYQDAQYYSSDESPVMRGVILFALIVIIIIALIIIWKYFF